MKARPAPKPCTAASASLPLRLILLISDKGIDLPVGDRAHLGRSTEIDAADGFPIGRAVEGKVQIAAMLDRSFQLEVGEARGNGLELLRIGLLDAVALRLREVEG